MASPLGDRSYYERRGNGIWAIHHVLPERLHVKMGESRVNLFDASLKQTGEL